MCWNVIFNVMCWNVIFNVTFVYHRGQLVNHVFSLSCFNLLTVQEWIASVHTLQEIIASPIDGQEITWPVNWHFRGVSNDQINGNSSDNVGVIHNCLTSKRWDFQIFSKLWNVWYWNRFWVIGILNIIWTNGDQILWQFWRNPYILLNNDEFFQLSTYGMLVSQSSS